MADLRATSGPAREFIGSDNGSTWSKMGGGPFAIPNPGLDQKHRSTVSTEVRDIPGAALWVVRGFSKLDDKPGRILSVCVCVCFFFIDVKCLTA
jgi:hypothetical protein